MKRIALFLLSALCLNASLNAQTYSFDLSRSQAQKPVGPVQTLISYVKAHPKCLRQDVFYDGCHLQTSSDGEMLMVRFQCKHPDLQMRILMKGLTIYIDPTGRKKEKYAVQFPSAADVQTVMEGISPRSDAMGQAQKRPDISPLLRAMNQTGAVFDIDGQATALPQSSAEIILSGEDNALVWVALVPIKQMLAEKRFSDNWTFTLYSEGGRPSKGSPGFGGGGMQRDRRPQAPSVAGQRQDNQDKDLRKLMAKDIKARATFSYSAICATTE